jgi:hypothetical protein
MGNGVSISDNMKRNLGDDKFANALVDEWRNTKYMEFLKQMNKTVSNISSFIKYSNVTQEMVERNLDFPWDFWEMSKYPHFIDLIRKYPDKQWCWFEVSRNASLTMDIVIDNPNKYWNFYEISIHPNLTLECCAIFYEKITHEFYRRTSFAIDRKQLFERLFEYEICDFATTLKTKLVIASIYEQSANNFCNNQIERVFADEYIVSRIIAFL